MSPEQNLIESYEALSPNISNLGEVLRQARIDRYITIQEMSEKCGFSSSTVSSIELSKGGSIKNAQRMFLVLRAYDMMYRQANQQHEHNNL
jgi:transcriptional regulator with XRE-family HTH domain